MPKKKEEVTISTSDLIKNVAAKFEELPKKITTEVLKSFLEQIETEIAAGNKVRIDKIGIFEVKKRAARMGRNPATGEQIKIPAGKKLAFRASKSLKDIVAPKKKKTSKKR